MPSQAVHEPLDLCLRIIEERAYARAKERVDRAEKAEDLPKDDPMIDQVEEIEFEIAREARARRLASG